MWQFFCHIGWFPYFFLTLTGSILTLCCSNITCDSSFVILGGSLTFFLHLTILSSYFALPTSHVTILFSHLVVPLLFSSYLTVSSSHYAVPTSQFQPHMWQFFCHIQWFPYFILTFNDFILTCDSSLSHLAVPLLFNHIWLFNSYIV